MLKKATKAIKYGTVVGTVAGTGYLYTQFKPQKLVWDLDHTLIQTVKVNKDEPNNLKKPDFTMSCKDTSKERYGYVRPFAWYTLKFFSMLALEQNVFTAATRDYAERVEIGANFTNLINETIAREDVSILSDELIEHLHKELRDKINQYHIDQNPIILHEWSSDVLDYANSINLGELDDYSLQKFAKQKYESLTHDSKQLRTMKLVGKDISAFNFCTNSTEGMILIDDKESAHKGHKDVGILIPRYDANKNKDYELLKVSWTLLKCFFTDDVKGTIKRAGYSPP